jgi:hypothetical protein
MEFLQAVDATLELIGRWPQIGRRVTNLPDDGSNSSISPTCQHALRAAAT